MLQLIGVLPITRRDLHHHEILVVGVVDRRDGALAEGVVEHRVDLVGREAVTRRRLPVDRDECLQAVLLHVGVDVGQLPRMLAELVDQPGHQRVDRTGIVAAQRVLVFRRGLAAADTEVLLGLQE